MRTSAKILAVSVTVLVGVEVFARIVLGLGTPPLSISHPTIEYMFKPNQELIRFHNRQFFNEVGMRSGPVPSEDEGTIVLVIGDSVVNGGNQTDQARLATELVRLNLTSADTPVFVGNVSAGSWGPANQLAYLKEYGLFGAEAVVLVLSSHDASDVPSFVPLDVNTHPTQAPALALWEGVTRYLPRFLPFLQRAKAPAPLEPPGAALGAIQDMVALIRRARIPVCVVHHLTRTELSGGLTADGLLLAAALEEMQVPYMTDGPVIQEALTKDSAPYLDNIHLSASGQIALAQAIEDCLDLAKKLATE